VEVAIVLEQAAKAQGGKMYTFSIDEVERSVREDFPEARDLVRVICSCKQCNGADATIIGVSPTGAAEHLGPAVLFAATVSPIPQIIIKVMHREEEVMDFSSKMLFASGSGPNVSKMLSHLWAAWLKVDAMRRDVKPE
jgi:hypothetical protein